MAKKEQNSHLQIISDIRKKNFKPVYFLMGDESYYIDLITDTIIDNALDDVDRDFNQTIVYGADVEISAVINAAKRYPMMAARQLVVVKEAQMMKSMDELLFYLQKPLMSTVLVLNYKNGTLKNKKLLAELNSVGIVYESKKLYDYQLPTFITNYIAEKGLTIEQKAVSMLGDAIGSDLSRLTGELDKLFILCNGDKRITASIVERNIGISKDFNNFELLNALIVKDILKVNRIITHFEKNPRSNPLIVTISVLFNFYANLMLLYFAHDKSENGIMTELKLRNIFQARDYQTAMKNYNAFKCIDIISYIRIYDARSKGVENAPGTSDASLLRELAYKILH
ncbi:DNA polymerase III subunit delta [Coprobacter sp.]